MMLRIGIKGFSLLEVMVATCILALGLILIYESFFTLLDSYSYYTNYLRVVNWLEEKFWEVQDGLMRLGDSFSVQPQGTHHFYKNFNWDLSYNLMDTLTNLYQINLTLFWKEGKRQIELLRDTYVFYKKEE
ncbi:MAG: prepilin-type N-terminal cleavage/methylation domain-containing protein [Candidatus Omnitrophica bacterium]|nr:prepilin-type N-terminal cleavage/methylation domain-containing protein [Candidatus Omnitrophota bacterium]